MLKQVRRWLPERAIVVVGDSRFSVLELLHCTSQLHQPVHLVSRLRLDAALYQPAPPRQAHQMGRPRLKGKRLPHLADVLTHAQTLWQSVVLPGLYGNTERQLGIGSGTAVWYHPGKPVVPIRGNPTAMVRPGNPPHHACTLRLVLLWQP
jgi:hypothetical protein